MNHTVEYLKNAISDKMELVHIVDIFEQVCRPLYEDEMILFETGTYDFTGEELYYFSLVKQFPNDYDDEYYQIHVDVLYKPCNENKSLNKTIWDEDIDEDIFDYIRKSDDFNYAKNDEYIRVEIHMDET